MLIAIKLFAKLLKTLNSEESPNQLAAGFAFGALVGLIPVKGLLGPVLLVLSFLLNINLLLVALGAALFKVISFALDPLANQIGYGLLVKAQGLKKFWTFLYNTPLLPYTRFNNTIVLGSLVLGLLLFIPLFLLAKRFVRSYRTRLREKILKWRITQIFQTTALYRYYQVASGFFGD